MQKVNIHDILESLKREFPVLSLLLVELSP